MYEKLTDFGSVIVAAGAGAAQIFTGEIDLGADRNIGLSDSDPVLVLELDNADAGASSTFKAELLHADATNGTDVIGTSTVVLTSGSVLNPPAGVLLEIPLPRMHRRFLRVRLTGTGAAIAANVARAYIANGGNAGHVSMKMPV